MCIRDSFCLVAQSWCAMRDGVEAVRIEVAHILCEKYNVDHVEECGDRLGDVVWWKDISEVLQFVTARAPLNVLDRNGCSPLMLAAVWGHTEIARALIAAGAKLDPVNTDGCTALILAIACGQMTIASMLAEQGEALALRDGNGWDALMWAAYYDQPEVIRVLVRAGMIPDFNDPSWNEAMQDVYCALDWVSDHPWDRAGGCGDTACTDSQLDETDLTAWGDCFSLNEH
eukprot:TRINITY_DN2102_c0_g1_i4.p1 TRINITY_DN2102_c0_g1~~TRINITY_DN2102_c0_g1_i4.p1  ORF type:complete len:229 (+),score=33.43 TRINITY_DN2102_c0_g1_i4:148-834(+)